ncbi:hypothetical protein D9Q98_009076 [Chlorella vulgaris]|uniref:Uncharacterized protein n=1 Tax=Chlorella vulgaris TaxID=3077 RepID=A0A9D4TH66_CHLVU|nr:hypothetical protein D9Q98_009076 [Chlorella vulgaris]
MLHALQQALNTHKQRAQELTTLLDKRQADSGARQRAAKLKATQDELGLLRAQLHALAGQEKQAAAQLEEACATARRLKEALRSGVRLANVADIDEQIAELEGRLAGRGLVELEQGQEARVQQQIETLRKSRSNVEELRSKASQLAGDSSAMDGLQQGLAAVQESMAAAKAREGELVQALAELKAEEAESQAGIPGLVAERDECRAMCKAAYSRITELRQQQDEVWQEFLSRKAAFQEQQAQAAAAHGARQEQAAAAAAAAAAALTGAGAAQHQHQQEAHGSALSQDRPGSGEEEPPLDQQGSGGAETAAQQAAALASTAALAGVDRGSSSSTVNETSGAMKSRSSLREGQGGGGNRPGGRV